jgi:8-oxo-dGTP pyrophosphatase MutT (NUDIX family)
MFDSRDAQVVLETVLRRARKPLPVGWQVWRLDGHAQPLGLMPADRALELASLMPANLPLVSEAGAWVWKASEASAASRSEVLQMIAEHWQASGLISGWRNEAYSCWGTREDSWPYSGVELFRLERAAFRTLGLRSHAVHINGLTADGQMWCGRRAAHKATDPGLLDNLAAGGLAAGEEPVACAVRELFEEAGLTRTADDLGMPFFSVVTEREVPEGWHSERLFVGSVHLSSEELPRNVDGEVSGFQRFTSEELVRRISAGEFTEDAACAIAVAFSASRP